MKNEVCHVGFTASDCDRLRVNKVISFLDTLGEPIDHWRVINQDLVNMADPIRGRDFLAESFEYRVVILHFLFRPHNMGLTKAQMKMPDLTTSPLHSWMAWRNRLLASRADYIFPFGGTTEISGSFISNLPGYNLFGPVDGVVFSRERFDAIKDFWVYVKRGVRGPVEDQDLKQYAEQS